MFAELNCKCQSTLQLDDEENIDSIWSLVWRFANAHADCGYVTGGTPLETTPVKKIRRPEVYRD